MENKYDMKRIFIFGCSFTKYHWPTWADIMIKLLQDHNVSIECINLGRAGLGNVGIMHEIFKADIKYNFTNNDELFIMWTSWSREDRYRNGDWLVGGNVSINEHYNDEFIKHHWSIENDIIKNVTAMISINKSFADIIRFQCHASGFNLENFKEQCKTKEEKELFDIYYHYVPKSLATDFEELEYEMYTNFFPNDPYEKHPTVMAHLKFVEKHIAPLFNLNVEEITSRKFLSIDEWIKTKATDKEGQDKVYDLWKSWHKTSQD